MSDEKPEMTVLQMKERIQYLENAKPYSFKYRERFEKKLNDQGDQIKEQKATVREIKESYERLKIDAARTADNVATETEKELAEMKQKCEDVIEIVKKDHKVKVSDLEKSHKLQIKSLKEEITKLKNPETKDCG